MCCGKSQFSGRVGGGQKREREIRVALHQQCGSVVCVHAKAESSLTCPAMFLQGMLRHKL